MAATPKTPPSPRAAGHAILLGLTASVAAACLTMMGSHGALAASLDHHGDGADKADTGAFEFWPGASYDPAVPTLQSVIGHANGTQITRPEDAVRYMTALARAFPDRVKLYEYARSWEGRPLVYAAIGAPDKIAKLKSLQDGMHALSDPRTTSDEAARALIQSLPASVWLAYGVHGNEISSTDAALMTAYHLLAAQNDSVVEKILDNTVVFLDPVQNPDGRARFLHHFEGTRGLATSGSPIAAERNEPWPGGRTNHYLFDMNRDWFALTQPETVGRIEALRDWHPLIFVDAHEMGTDSTYYFTPEAVPYNPNLAPNQRDKLYLIGRNNAKWFDKNGFDYFTREVYDAFFPGYGASWPAYYGALAMTYEQSSARGLKAQRRNGTTYDFRDTVHRHFVASISTAEAAADNRGELLTDYWTYQKTAIDEGTSGDVQSYIFPATDDTAGAYRLAGLLTRQGVEVYSAEKSFSACGKTYGAGAQVISLAQPAKRLVRTLLDPAVPIDEDFVAEQERRRAKGLDDEIYDVTAWSLAQMYNLTMDACAATVATQAGFTRHDGAPVKPGTLTGPADAVAYLLPWGERPAINFIADALAEGLIAKSSDKAFSIGAQAYPAGTVIFSSDDNPDDLRQRLERLARKSGASVTALASTWVDDGPNFGSGNVVRLNAPRIAMAWSQPTSAYQAGNTRFVIERQLGFPVTPVHTDDLSSGALDQFDVLILPGQWASNAISYGTFLGDKTGRVAQWVRDGGTLIAMTGALRWVADPQTDLLSIRLEKAATIDDANPASSTGDSLFVDGSVLTTPDEASAAVQPAGGRPDATAGVLARAHTDGDHWLGAGVSETLITLLAGGDIWTPLTLDQGVNVVRFAGPDTLIAGGYIWAETKAQNAYKPVVVAERRGAGHVIGFTQDPAFRAQMDGLNVLLANALLRGPAHSGAYR